MSHTIVRSPIYLMIRKSIQKITGTRNFIYGWQPIGLAF